MSNSQGSYFVWSLDEEEFFNGIKMPLYTYEGKLIIKGNEVVITATNIKISYKFPVEVSLVRKRRSIIQSAFYFYFRLYPPLGSVAMLVLGVRTGENSLAENFMFSFGHYILSYILFIPWRARLKNTWLRIGKTPSARFVNCIDGMPGFSGPLELNKKLYHILKTMG